MISKLTLTNTYILGKSNFLFFDEIGSKVLQIFGEHKEKEFLLTDEVTASNSETEVTGPSIALNSEDAVIQTTNSNRPSPQNSSVFHISTTSLRLSLFSGSSSFWLLISRVLANLEAIFFTHIVANSGVGQVLFLSLCLRLLLVFISNYLYFYAQYKSFFRSELVSLALLFASVVMMTFVS
jgi:hypothetical protein